MRSETTVESFTCAGEPVPRAFTIIAEGYEDYERAMTTKLAREMQSCPREVLRSYKRLIDDWRPQTLDELTETDLEAVLALQPEIVVLGSGVYLWLGRRDTSLSQRLAEVTSGGRIEPVASLTE